MNVPNDATGTEVFPHDEYHFYIIDHNDEPRHIHLPEDVVQDARDLIDHDLPVDEADWLPKFWRDIGDGIYFQFCPTDPSGSEFYYCPMRGESKRIFGIVNDHIWFDSSFLGASTGPPADKEQHHYKDIRENIVLPEHRDRYMEELIAWEENGGWDTDWIQQ